MFDVTSEDVSQAFSVLAGLSVRGLDSLPLPLLVVVFIACLALLNYPYTTTNTILPSYSPSVHQEKDRLSPHPFFPSSRSSPFSTPPTNSASLFYPALDPSGRPAYFGLMSESTSSGARSPPRISTGSMGRRGSKRDSWRGGMGPLQSVEEETGEKMGA